MAPSERGWALIKIVSVLVGLAAISVVLRVLARLKRNVKLDIDDYLSFTALLLLFSMLIELILCKVSFVKIKPHSKGNLQFFLGCAIGGMGKHVTDMSTEEMLYFGKVNISA